MIKKSSNNHHIEKQIPFFNPDLRKKLTFHKNRNDLNQEPRSTQKYSPHSFLFEPFIPETTYQENHICKEIDSFQCDNSQNFIAQCADSEYSSCPLLDLVMDCRMKNSKLLYQSHIGPGFMSISNFGSNSKCVNVSDTSHNKSVACMHVECDRSGRAYYVSLPERFGKLIIWD